MKNNLFILISLILSGTYIFIFNFFLNKQNNLEDGFVLAKAVSETNICPVGKKISNKRKNKLD